MYNLYRDYTAALSSHIQPDGTLHGTYSAAQYVTWKAMQSACQWVCEIKIAYYIIYSIIACGRYTYWPLLKFNLMLSIYQCRLTAAAVFFLFRVLWTALLKPVIYFITKAYIIMEYTLELVACPVDARIQLNGELIMDFLTVEAAS